MSLLPLLCSTEVFAPKKDTVKIFYRQPQKTALASLKLQVWDNTNTLVLDEKVQNVGSEESLDWDGHLAPGVWANPLGSTYEVSLEAELIELSDKSGFSASSERPKAMLECPYKEKLATHEGTRAKLHVRYAAIVITRCPWKPEYLAEDKWSEPALLCANLNRRGYFAGLPSEAKPPEITERSKEPPLVRALRRFHFNHPKACADAFDAVRLSGLVSGTPELHPVMTIGENKPIAEDTAIPSASDVTEPLRIYVEAIGFEADYGKEMTEFETQYEFKDVKPKHKWHYEAERLNRPLVPLRAVILLKDREGKAVYVPEAVGPVTVRWEALEPEGGAGLMTDNWSFRNRPKGFVRYVYQRIYESSKSTNCPVELGGVRTKDRWWTNSFCLGKEIPGFDLKAVDEAKAVENKASVDPKRLEVLGTSCVFFCPSYIAGDRYRIKASLHFEGGQAKALAEANAGMQYQTGTIEIWRRVRIAAVLGWPARKTSHQQIVARAKKQFAKAYMHLDDSGVISAAVSDVIDQTAYNDLLGYVWTLLDKYASSSLKSLISPKLSPTGPFEINDTNAWKTDKETDQPKLKQVRPLGELTKALQQIRADGKLNFDNCENVTVPWNAEVAGNRVRSIEMDYLNTMGLFSGRLLSEQIQKGRKMRPAAAVISQVLRAGLAKKSDTYRPGVVVLDYRVTELVDLAGKLTSPNPATFSVGMEDLFAVTDQLVPGHADFIFAHEVGHCFMLRHHENAGDSERNKLDHDQEDHGCIMSYTDVSGRWPHQKPALYEPSFCGKCLLKLRGWNIHQGNVWPPQTFSRPLTQVVGIFDGADKKIKGDLEVVAVGDLVKTVSLVDMGINVFNQNIDFGVWLETVKGCDVYHHVTHGNQFCRSHKRRVVSLNHVQPSYPVRCIEEKNRSGFDKEEQELQTTLKMQVLEGMKPEEAAGKKLNWYTKYHKADILGIGTVMNTRHELEGVFQWAMSNDENTRNDITFHPHHIREGFKSGGAPRILAFLSCCLVGWNSDMADAFLDSGTPYVIAFRSRYNTNNAIPFATLFYTRWAMLELEPSQIPVCFRFAAGRYPGAEPVLFTKNDWTRVWAVKNEREAVSAYEREYKSPPPDDIYWKLLEVRFENGIRFKPGAAPPEFTAPHFHL